jgi:hypothetical protein
MLSPSQALSAIPDGLRGPLLAEYGSLVQNFFEHRWSPAELSGGRLCEIVFSILDGYAKGQYAAAPFKPSNFVQSCRAFENHGHVPRSFQILLPRLLPALYEIRNNRGVGHVGGDVDSNHMDATAVLAMANWVMAELVRVFHAVPVVEAQEVVDSLVERRIPLVWQTGDVRRVLNTSLALQDQLLVLLASTPVPLTMTLLSEWTDYPELKYLRRLLRKLHSERLIEFTETTSTVQILPPGAAHVERIVVRLTTTPKKGVKSVTRRPRNSRSRR